MSSLLWNLLLNYELSKLKKIVETCCHLSSTKVEARVKEIGTRWNQRCLIIHCVPIFLKGRSLTSVVIFVPSWYPLICIVKFNIFEIKLISRNDGGGLYMDRAPPSMKFKITCISTESKTFYPHEKCRTHINKTIFARQWRHSLCNNHYGPLYFLLVPISFRCPIFISLMELMNTRESY